MYDAPEPTEVVPAPPCTCCSSPAEAQLWGSPVCEGCYRAWWDETPTMDELEREHAAKHPEDVELRGEYQFRDSARKHSDWLILKPGITEKLGAAAAQAWISARQQKFARRSA